MPRPRLVPLSLSLVTLAIVVAACSSAGASVPAEGSTPPDNGAESTAAQPSEAASADDGVPEPGTALNACEIVTPADVEAALGLEAGTVAEGELGESPTILSPGHTDCRYSGDWGGLVVSLTPEDGANLYDAARGSYDDASDRELSGADGAFWSEDTGRFFAWKGAVAVMLQFTHLTADADRDAAMVSIGQAAMDRVD